VEKEEVSEVKEVNAPLEVKDVSKSEVSSITPLSPITLEQSDNFENNFEQQISTKQSQSEQRFIGLERLMMTLITRYGEQLIDGTDADGKPTQTTLAEYVQGDLAFDDISLRSPLYAKMLTLVCQHVHDEGFTATKFLLNNQDEDISREAADLVSDRYQLSKGNQMEKSEEELKVAYLNRLILDYKNAIVEEELKQCNADLTRPEVKENINKTLDTIRRMKELGKIQRQLAKMLGDRVVVK
jgi:DNA primase